jgi:hypothetical protein
MRPVTPFMTMPIRFSFITFSSAWAASTRLQIFAHAA